MNPADALDSLTAVAQGLMSSPWFYLVLVGFTLFDAVIPVFPSEAVIIAAAVFSLSSGTPDIALVVLAALLGAFLGDHTTYTIGRLLGPAVLRRAGPGSKRRRSVATATRALAERGGIAIVAARHIPGGRTAVCLTCGLTRYERPRFALWSFVACSLWALMNGAIGVVGGIAFADDPVLGMVTGMAIAITLGVGGELAGRVHRRRKARAVT